MAQTVSRCLLTVGQRLGFDAGQVVCDLWWSARHWDRCVSPVLGYSSIGVVPPMLHTHFHLSTVEFCYYTFR
jgi:hypothetical protein